MFRLEARLPLLVSSAEICGLFSSRSAAGDLASCGASDNVGCIAKCSFIWLLSSPPLDACSEERQIAVVYVHKNRSLLLFVAQSQCAVVFVVIVVFLRNIKE